MFESLAPNQVLPLLQCYIAMPLLVMWARRRIWFNGLAGSSPLRRLARACLHALFAAWTILAVLVLAGFHLSRVSGMSMAPTFLDGEWIVCNANAYAAHWPFWGKAFTSSALPSRGDVITFYHPDPATHEPTLLIKRVIGLPGDVITQSRGRIRVNGRPLAPAVWHGGERVVDGHFVQFSSLSRAFPRSATWTLGPGDLFVMGDHWDHSWDSRSWGVLPVDRIATKVLSRGNVP